jgi:hypothetical protein
MIYQTEINEMVRDALQGDMDQDEILRKIDDAIDLRIDSIDLDEMAQEMAVEEVADALAGEDIESRFRDRLAERVIDDVDLSGAIWSAVQDVIQNLDIEG